MSRWMSTGRLFKLRREKHRSNFLYYYIHKIYIISILLGSSFLFSTHKFNRLILVFPRGNPTIWRKQSCLVSAFLLLAFIWFAVHCLVAMEYYIMVVIRPYFELFRAPRQINRSGTLEKYFIIKTVKSDMGVYFNVLIKLGRGQLDGISHLWFTTFLDQGFHLITDCSHCILTVDKRQKIKHQ